LNVKRSAISINYTLGVLTWIEYEDRLNQVLSIIGDVYVIGKPVVILPDSLVGFLDIGGLKRWLSYKESVATNV